jgi:hypothetical protein
MPLNIEQRALVPRDDNPPLVRSLLRFLPFAIAFSVRHLTIGTAVRARRRYLRWRRRPWIL